MGRRPTWGELVGRVDIGAEMTGYLWDDYAVSMEIAYFGGWKSFFILWSENG